MRTPGEGRGAQWGRPWSPGTASAPRRVASAALQGGLALVVTGSLIVAVAHGAHPGPGGTLHRPPATPVAGARPDGAPGAATPKSLTLAAAADLPADCLPNPAGPPGSPYQLGLVGTVRDGTLRTSAATVANIDATFCGVVTVVNGTPPCRATGSVVSPQDGQVFGSLSVELTLVPAMTPTIGFVANPGTITGGFSCGSSQNGLSVTLDATVSGSTGALFGVSCTIGPLTIPLTGVVTGPFTDMTATLTSNDFTVPAIAPSATCPGAVVANIDAIAGLPLASGAASATLPVTAALYQPAA